MRRDVKLAIRPGLGETRRTFLLDVSAGKIVLVTGQTNFHLDNYLDF
jgi:hypothetical protein